LVAPRERCAEHLEHLVESLLANHVTDADKVDILGRNFNGEIALSNIELQVQFLYTLMVRVFTSVIVAAPWWG